MEILKYLGVYGVGFVTLLILDYIWLGTVTKDFIIREFGELVSVTNGKIDIKLWAGILSWISISILVVTFVTLRFNTYPHVLFFGALMGCMMYAMYDLTNITFLTEYSLKFTLVDIAWGTFACSIVALSSYGALQLFQK